jgi:hypothetical protein
MAVVPLRTQRVGLFVEANISVPNISINFLGANSKSGTLPMGCHKKKN